MIENYSNLTIKSKLRAFTLSEVLLVLSVIGVVAALTIPTLIQKVSDDQYKAAWKKSFSAFSQATSLMLANNGGDIENAFTTDDTLRNEYTKHMTFVKTCDSASTAGNCWSSASAFKHLYGGTAGISGSASGILSDGTLVRVGKAIGVNPSISAFNTIAVDVNGLKGPNTIGKDIFYIWVTNSGAKPWGISGDLTANDPATTCIENNTAVTNTGYGCSAKYLYQ